MRSRQHTALGLAAAACLILSGCTNAADWNANRSSQIHSYDTSSIQAQPDIIAKLPQGALDDGVLDVAASTDYAPAEFLDPSGKAVGYDVDLTNANRRGPGRQGKGPHRRVRLDHRLDRIEVRRRYLLLHRDSRADR